MNLIGNVLCWLLNQFFLKNVIKFASYYCKYSSENKESILEYYAIEFKIR